MQQLISHIFQSSNHRSVNSQHLINAFQATMLNQGFDDFGFEAAFRTWELQPGYPVIHVSFGGFTRSVFFITQERFFTKQHRVKDDFSTWHIPLNFAIESNPSFDDTSFSDYFNTGSDSIILDAPTQLNSSQWYIFNKQQLGYYRVNYEIANWQALTNALNSDAFDTIHILNRAQIVDDSINLALSGYLDYEVVFDILTYLSRETEYTAWYAADLFIDQLYARFGTMNNELNVS